MSRARDLSRLSSPSVFSVDASDASNNKVGLGSENPTAKLNVAGIVSATAFYGDGSNLEGVSGGGSAGLGTALGENNPLDVIYYTNDILNVSDNTTITVPTGSDTAYTQYAEVVVADTKDLIVADGDDFIPDILGLSTEGITPITGTGGRVRADFYTNHAGTGAPTFQTGVNVTGVVTATTFSGNVTGNVTGNASGTAGGLTGTPDITVRNITGVGATFTGVLTYEDVTNVDSIGIITARSGIDVTGAVAGYDYLQAPFGTTVNFAVTVASKTAAHRYPAGGSSSSNGYVIDGVESPFLTLTPGRTYRFTLSSGDMSNHPFRFYLEANKTTPYTTNVNTTATYTEITVTDSTPQVLHYQCSVHGYMGNAVNTNSNAVVSSETAIFRGGLAEKINVKTQLTSANACAITDGNVILTTGNEPGNTYPDITGVHSVLVSGEGFSVTVALKVNGSGTINAFRIDGVAQTIEWSGGSAPSAGSSGYDVFTFSAFKTGSGTTDYTVFGAAINYD